MSTLHGRIHQWARANGARQVHSDLLLARTFRMQRATRQQAHVFIAVQAVDHTPASHAACALVAQTIAATLQTDRSLAITSALRQAFAAAHAALCAHNDHVSAAEQTLVGASCAVLHATSLYIAQVQPAHAWVQHNRRVRAVPSWNDAAPTNAAHALGGPLYTAPELNHTPVVPGDLLVLCSQSVAHATYADQINTLLRTNDAPAVADALYAVCTAARVQTAHALVVEWATREPARPAAPEPHALPSALDHEHAPRVLAHDQTLPPEPIVLPAKHRRRTAGHGHATPQTTPPRSQTPSAGRSARRSTVRSTPLTAAGAVPHARRSQPAKPPTRRSRSTRRRAPVHWLVTLLVACVVALVGTAVQQWRHQSTGVALAAIAQVEQAVTEAESAATPTGAQQALAAAQAAFRTDVEPLLQSGTITTTEAALWNAYTGMLGRYEQALTTIDHVTFADDLRTAATLPGEEGLISRVALGAPTQPGGTPSLFLLDRSRSRVWQAGQPKPMIEKGTEVAGVPVARIRDMVWRGDTLLLLERGDRTAPAYRLVYQNTAQWQSVPLARTDTMAPRDGDLPVATFGGNVYVWDRDTKQVWQYSAGQLSMPPTPTIGNTGGVSLDRVVDIAVDGRIYLLNNNGSIVVIHNGAVVEQWPAPQLSVPLGTVTRFVVTPTWTSADGTQQSGAIYVLDTQHERVVQLDKTTGAVIQQLQARQHGTLNQLTDLAVDEAGRMLYVANGNTLLQAPLSLPVPGSTPAPSEPVK